MSVRKFTTADAGVADFLPTVKLHSDLAKFVSTLGIFDFIQLGCFCVVIVRVLGQVLHGLCLVRHTIFREEVLTYLCANGLIPLAALTRSILCRGLALTGAIVDNGLGAGGRFVIRQGWTLLLL